MNGKRARKYRREFTDAEKIAIADEYITAIYSIFERTEPPIRRVDRRINEADRRKK